MASISLKNIVKKYSDTVTAVKNFSLEIEDREFIVLVGPSGCGKSTLLRMIAGLETITDGMVSIGDKPVNTVSPKDRNIAMVFQNYALYPHMNVYQNMAFGLKMRKMNKKFIEDKILETAARLHISELLKRKPSELSGGQKQRVALGRAMVREPEVFLFDEPLSNLDAKLRTEMRLEISKIHRELQTTFVYVTHDQTEAMTMADRIVIMKDGCIQQVDTPEEVYLHPKNRFVAEFIGTPKMNLYQTQLQKNETQYFVTLWNQQWPVSTDRFIKEDLEKYVGKEITVGIRPHDIKIIDAEEKKNLALALATVEFIEALGTETHIYLQSNQGQITVSAPGQRNMKVSQQVSLKINPDGIHLFDRDTEQGFSRKRETL